MSKEEIRLFYKKNGIKSSNFKDAPLAFSVENSLKVLELFEKSKIIILGGDILINSSDEIVYAHYIWGDEYQYLNWHCEKVVDEKYEDYLNRGYNLSKAFILKANEIARSKNCQIFILFVTNEYF